MSAKKATPTAVQTRGSGRPNKLYIQDFATREKIFRVETEIRRTKANGKDFDMLVKLARARKRTKGDVTRAIKLASHLVDGLGTPASEARAAKDMFATALTVV